VKTRSHPRLGALLALMLLSGVLFSAFNQHGVKASPSQTRQPLVASFATTIITANNVGTFQYNVCDPNNDGWHFIINGLSSAAQAPLSIDVIFLAPDGVTEYPETIDLDFVAGGGKTAHYISTTFLPGYTVKSASAVITTPFTGNFVLSHVPCYIATPSATPTNTSTPIPSTHTPTNTPTNTPTVTNTPTDTATNTPTVTDTPTNTPTDTPTNTPTNTPTDTATPTNTATDTPTNTPTNTPTDTPTNTPTNTPTPIPATSTPIPFQGCTPGYWKQQQHFDSWVVYTPGTKISSIFTVPGSINLGDKTFLQALSFSTGKQDKTGAETLLRAAVAALLNASNPNVDYSYTTTQIVDWVNAAMATGNRQTMLNLATQLDNANNYSCPLN